MGMIVVMIRWVCFIDHAFRPATPPAHNALPMRRGGGQQAKQRPPRLPWLLPVGEESPTHVIDLDGLVEGLGEVFRRQDRINESFGHDLTLI